MQMRPIQEGDLNEISSWLAYHKQVDIDLQCMPDTGFIAPGVAAFFYTVTNHNTMWIDSFITNPRAELKERREIARVIAAMVYFIAKENKIKRLFFLTRNKAVERVYSRMLRASDVGTFKLYRTDYVWD